MPYPLGGMEIQNNDVGVVELRDGVYDNGILLGITTAFDDALIPAGTILGRVTATGTLVPFTLAGTHGTGSDTPIGILGDDVQEAATAVDINLRFLVSGLVRQSRLIVYVGTTPGTAGDLGNAAAEALLKDQLRDFTLVAQETTDLSALDNQ